MARREKKHTDTLIHLGTEAELWRTTDGQPFATVEDGGTHQNLEVDSNQFQRWLARRFWEEEETAAGANGLKQAIEVLAAMAIHEGTEHDTFIRLARHGPNVYLDRGGLEWHTIEITPEGWQPVQNPPVRFRRSPRVGELPWPESGGSLDDLCRFVNVRGDRDFVLAVSWLLGALNPGGPFPIALIQGEQGSAKSTLTRVLRSLIDPATPIHTTKPKSEQDLVISAHNSWVQAFDNLSKIPGGLSDAFCRIATGGGFKTRRLYHDTEEISLYVCRPQILNGIEDLATRDDLRDRGILFELPAIVGGDRKPERQFWAEFDEARPRILGALLDAVSTALREQPHVNVEELPRMADFATWVIGAEKGLPWQPGTFLDAYEENQRDASSLVLENSELGQRMIRFAEEHMPWDGTPTELYAHIWGRTGNLRGGRATAASMSQDLKRIAPSLRHRGIDVTWHRENDRNRTRKIAVRAVHGVQGWLEDLHDEERRSRTVAVPVEVVDGLVPVG